MTRQHLWPTQATRVLGPVLARAALAPAAGLALLALVLQPGTAPEDSWWAAVPIGLAVLVLLLLPGWSLCQAWGARGLTALGAAPAVTGALLTCASALSSPLGAVWDRGHLLTGPTMWLWGAGVVAGLSIRLLPKAQGDAPGPSALSHSERVLVGLGLALAILLAGVPVLLASGSLSSPLQASDAVYHLSVTAFVRQSGEASPLAATAPMYDGHSSYYPTLWHAIAAVLPGSVVAGANVMVLVLAAVVWPLSMAALLREVLWQRATDQGDQAGQGVLLAAGVALSGSVVSVLLLLTSVWPYALSVCLLPGALALVVRACAPGSLGPRGRALALVVAALGCVGVVGAHGTGAFNLAVLGGPLVLAGLAPVTKRAWAWGGRRRAGLVLATTICLLAVAGGAWLARGPLASVLTYERPAGNLPETLYAIVSDHPLLATFTPYVPGNALVLVLALLAALNAWRPEARPQTRLWTWATVASMVLLLLAAGPQWPLRVLAGPWYTQRARIMALVTIGLLVLAPLGLEALARQWRDRPGWRQGLAAPPARLAAVSLLVSLVAAPAWRWGLRTEIMEAVHDPQRISYGTMLSQDELELGRRASTRLPADAVVIANPSNGSAYLWSVAGVRVVYPSRLVPWTEELEWLGEHLHEIGSEPRVCQVLRERGVGYYYSDDAPADGTTGGGREPLWGEHMEEVPRQHLELLDSASSGGGTATLWRIAACD